MSILKLILASAMIMTLSFCLMQDMNTEKKDSLMVADQSNLTDMKLIAKRLDSRLFQYGFTHVVDECFAENFMSQSGLHMGDFNYDREELKHEIDKAYSHEFMLANLEKVDFARNAIVLYWDCAVDAYGIPQPTEKRSKSTGVSFYYVEDGKIVSSYSLNIVSDFYHTLSA